MRLSLDLRALALAIPLASTACSDDGLANQSSGLAETTTTGPPSDAADPASGGAGSTRGLDGDTSAPPPDASTSGPSDPATGTGTSGVEGATGTSDGSGTGDDAASSGTTGGDHSCADGCVVEVACGTEWESEDACVTACEANLVKADAFSPFCRDAWAALSACLATLTCEEFSQWQSPMMFPYPCSDADTVLSIECKGQ